MPKKNNNAWPVSRYWTMNGYCVQVYTRFHYNWGNFISMIKYSDWTPQIDFLSLKIRMQISLSIMDRENQSKGITNLRIYQYWIFHHTVVIQTCFEMINPQNTKNAWWRYSNRESPTWKIVLRLDRETGRSTSGRNISVVLMTVCIIWVLDHRIP